VIELNWQDKNVLVTGGAGFIGSNLVERLVHKSASVRVVDNLSRGKLAYLEDVKNDVEFIKGDLTNEDACRKAVEDMDVVFHLAAIVGGINFLLDKEADVYRENSLMDTYMFKAAIDSGVERYLYTSSACTYPREATPPVTEDVAAKGTLDSSYGWAKWAGEIQAIRYAHDYGAKIAIARCFNVYGPNEDFSREKSHVIPALIHKAVDRDNPYIVFGSGEQTRSFIYVDDAVDGMIKMIESYCVADPVNIGTPEMVKIKDLARKILDIVGYDVEITLDRSMPEGVHDRAANNSKAREKIGWVPKIDLEEGLRRTIDWYKEHQDLFE